ncbi:MAG TPA: N-acyl homoserine lactonase family protein [Nitrososphaerales archaeon]|nr:N-acyl homoserine lactonase family protein [Nitrososphaerales archaeon]
MTSGAKVYLLDGGQFQQDQSIVTFAIGAGEKVWSQVYSVYIDHPEAKMIVETGMDPDLWSPMLKQILVPKQAPEQRLDNALKKLGVKPEDVDIVINTHLHADHCSFNRLFKNATWIINRNELKQALVPEPFEITYFRPCFDVGLKTQLLESDREYSPVKGVEIIDTFGHTAGHVSVAVETERSGTFLITGDAAMTKENLWGSERTSPLGWPCAPCLDQRAFMRSLEKMREYVSSIKARTMKTCSPIYGHDADEFAKLKHAPYAYE